MDLGTAVRQLLSEICGESLRHAKAHTAVEALETPGVRRSLGAHIEAAFGVRVPDEDLARLRTVRDVVQCVRLYRWAKRVEDERPQASAAEDVSATSETTPATDTPTTIAAQALDPQQRRFRITRRRAIEPPPASLGERPPATPGSKRL